MTSEEFPAEQLLARIAQHDVDALSELYDRYAPRVYGLLAHILPASGGAEEILQEVFVRLWNESPRLCEEGRSVAAWLVVTARAAAVDRLRALRRSEAAGPGKGSERKARLSKAGLPAPSAAKIKSDAPKSVAAGGAGPVAMGPLPLAWLPQPKEITMIDGRLALLHKALGQLPKPQRQALELAVFGGLSESEIAAEVGEPLGKVRTSLRAAVTFVKHRRRAVCGTWAANI